MVDELAFATAEAEALAIQNQTGFLPALDDPRLNAREILFWLPIEGDGKLDDLIGMQLSKDHATRAVVGATIYVLMIDNPAGEVYDTLNDAFRRFVESVAVADLSDPALLRWELHLAATADFLERALEIGRRFEDIGTTADLRALLANTVFLLVHPGSRSLEFLTTPSAFDPLIHPPQWDVRHVSDLLTYTLATIVEKRGELEWREPETFPPPVLDALIDIDTLLRRLRIAAKSLTPTQCAIQSWVWFAEGAANHDAAKLNEAGRGYLTLPAHPPVNGVVGPRLNQFAAATRSFALAANWAAALEAARTWIAEAPQDGHAYGRLAEAHFKLDEIPEAIRAYEEFVRLSKESDDDWQSSFLLKLGLEAIDRRTAVAAFETAAFSASIRPQGERLISWSYPWFDTLSRKAKERWWVGMFALSSPHVGTQIGDQRWDVAANCFGAAVEFELKERVFEPFATSSAFSSNDEYWKRALAGRGMLGDLINCLLQTRQRNNQQAKELSRWLAAHHPRLAGHIQKAPPQRLLRISTLRGQAQHGSVSEAETREVFAEAAALLNVIAGSSR